MGTDNLHNKPQSSEPELEFERENFFFFSRRTQSDSNYNVNEKLDVTKQNKYGEHLNP